MCRALLILLGRNSDSILIVKTSECNTNNGIESKEKGISLMCISVRGTEQKCPSSYVSVPYNYNIMCFKGNIFILNFVDVSEVLTLIMTQIWTINSLKQVEIIKMQKILQTLQLHASLLLILQI